MIDLYSTATPNGLKISLCLEELAVPYQLHPIKLSQGEQFAPDFLAKSPNNKIPAIVDNSPADGGAPVTLFESGAILWYLADKYRRFLPEGERARMEAMQWLFWQMAGLGPMGGQAGHFRAHAPEAVPYGIERYTREIARLFGVLEKRLAGRDYICGDYSIVDIACYPWVLPYNGFGIALDDVPNIAGWLGRIGERPAVKKVFAGWQDPYGAKRHFTEAERAVLFGAKA